MADGDPMVFQTLYGDDVTAPTGGFHSIVSNGRFEDWDNGTTSLPEGWVGADAGGQPASIYSRQAGTRTGGSGSYFQRISWVSPIVGQLFSLTNITTLNGHFEMDGRGHVGSVVKATVWYKANAANRVNFQVYIQELDAAGVWTGGSSGSGTLNATTVWQSATWSRTITESDCAKLSLFFLGNSSNILNIDLDVDECSMWLEYTLPVNPSQPDQQRIIVPGRKLMRTSDGSLIRGRTFAASAKVDKSLNFGLIGLAQMEAMRSLHLIDMPMLWTTNQPHMPAKLFVLPAGSFDFRLMRGGSFGSNHYTGKWSLTEV